VCRVVGATGTHSKRVRRPLLDRAAVSLVAPIPRTASVPKLRQGIPRRSSGKCRLRLAIMPWLGLCCRGGAAILLRKTRTRTANRRCWRQRAFRLASAARDKNRVRQSDADLKPPRAAAVKSCGGEHRGNVGTRSRQVRLREASASEPRSRPEADLKQLREFANTEVW
jgi:hypothetical protein